MIENKHQGGKETKDWLLKGHQSRGAENATPLLCLQRTTTTTTAAWIGNGLEKQVRSHLYEVKICTNLDKTIPI